MVVRSAFAHLVLELEGRGCHLATFVALTEVAEYRAQSCISEREFGIELDRPAEERNASRSLQLVLRVRMPWLYALSASSDRVVASSTLAS